MADKTTEFTPPRRLGDVAPQRSSWTARTIRFLIDQGCKQRRVASLGFVVDRSGSYAGVFATWYVSVYAIHE